MDLKSYPLSFMKSDSSQYCFVIQPFGKRDFDERYTKYYSEVIKDCELIPYRVDRDYSIERPLDAIREGILNATIVLADISLNNPNVWYEVGFAMACNAKLIMICDSSIRKEEKIPFDIKDRNVIFYQISSPILRQNFITELKGRIQAALKILQMESLKNNEEILGAEVTPKDLPEKFVEAIMTNDDFWVKLKQTVNIEQKANSFVDYNKSTQSIIEIEL